MAHPLSQAIFQLYGANMAGPMGAEWLAELHLHRSAFADDTLVSVEEWQFSR